MIASGSRWLLHPSAFLGVASRSLCVHASVIFGRAFASRVNWRSGGVKNCYAELERGDFEWSEFRGDHHKTCFARRLSLSF